MRKWQINYLKASYSRTNCNNCNDRKNSYSGRKALFKVKLFYTCRVISITGRTCTHYRITNWNFTVSEEVSSTTFIKVDHTQPRIKTYNYYSMVILCKCSINKNNSFQIGLPLEISNTNRFTF